MRERSFFAGDCHRTHGLPAYTYRDLVRVAVIRLR